MRSMGQFEKDQGGLIPLVVLAIIGLIALFGIWGMSLTSWKGVIAVLAAGTIAMAVAGAVFFKANWNYVLLAIIMAFAIVFITEISFLALIGGLMVVFALWNFKILSKNIAIFVALVGIGLLVMLISYKLMLLEGLI
ncbi:MAG: hypothetical protein APZ16_04500 [Candidatus Hadarchaeum yellowstonense]|uniref:Uncharacterized protein n=1 Tax=Hadarchaeum yellowstonense TaxID=1776334 RepID=A0A147JVX3_HADYE|nr:MAG: hypothetical protein APZ16_04500 [Candidatus Hadarchaeum yellowstonense]